MKDKWLSCSNRGKYLCAKSRYTGRYRTTKNVYSSYGIKSYYLYGAVKFENYGELFTFSLIQ